MGYKATANQLQLSFVAVAHAHNHVVEQGAVQTVQRAAFLAVVRTAQGQHAVVDGYVDTLVYFLVQLPFRAFYLDDVFFANGNLNAFRKGDGCFTYT